MFSTDRVEPFIQGGDDTFYMLWVRSLIIDGDINFANDIAETPFLEDHARQIALNEPLTSTGLVENKFTVGWAIMSAPLYLVAHWIAHWTPWPQDGFSVPYQIGIWLQQILIACLGFYLLWRILLRWFDSEIALIAILSTWLISPMIYYQTARITMVHNAVFVLAMLIIWLALKIKEHLEKEEINPRHLLLLTGFAGTQAGLMVICRPSAMVYLILPVFLILGAMIPLWKSHRWLFFAMVGVAAGGAFVGVFPQLLAWKSIYGSWIYYSYQGEGFNWASPKIYTSLFSAHHGLFNWHPMLGIGLIVLIVASWKKQFYRSWIITMFLIIWTNSSWHMVHFGSAFGGRVYEFLVCFAMIGMAFLLDWTRGKNVFHNVLLSVFMLFSCWNIVFMYLYMRGIVSREDPVTWLERLRATFQIFG